MLHKISDKVGQKSIQWTVGSKIALGILTIDQGFESFQSQIERTERK